jgi:hypothetical protein
MATDNNVYTYDPKQVVVTFGGIIVSGYAEGTFISIASNGDSFAKRKGSDGSVDRINMNVYDYSVTLTLMMTSPTNALLSAALIADKETNTGVVPLTVTDLSGNSVFTAAQAWIAKDPDDEYGDSLATREWRIDTGAAVKSTGGNAE